MKKISYICPEEKRFLQMKKVFKYLFQKKTNFFQMKTNLLFLYKETNFFK